MTARALPTIAKLAYVALMIALVSVGTLNMLGGGIKDQYLWGVEVTAPAPKLSFDAVRKEAFQRDAVQWFEQHWGLRGYAVRTDNTVVLSLFDEARSGQAVVGRSGVLISDEDLRYVNRPDPPEETIVVAQTIARVQKKMRAVGKSLIPVITPAKTSFYRDAVPDGWKRRGAYERADENLYGAFVRSLGEAGATFVDGRALYSEEHRGPDEVFAATGRHWRLGVACRLFQATLDAVRHEIPEIGSDQIDCRTKLDPEQSVVEEDYDLFRLLNVWTPPVGVNVQALEASTGPSSLRVPTLFIGSSFMMKFLRIARSLELFRPSLFYYYDMSVIDTTTFATLKKVEPDTDEWRADTFSKRLFIMGILETYIPIDGKKFLDELEKELDLRAVQGSKTIQ